MNNIRIIIDARPLAYPGTGNATYLYRMLKALIKTQEVYDWVLISNKGIHPEYSDILLQKNVEVHISLGLVAKLGPLWLHFQVPKIIKEHDGSLFWATLAILPFHFKKRAQVPSMLNIHDLNAFVAPHTMKTWNKWQHKLWDHKSATQADSILCLSCTTKNDLLKYFPDLDKSKLHIVYPGYESKNQIVSKKPDLPIGNLSHFFLCVGTIEPRKNQTTLLDAYLNAQSQKGFPPLLFVGRKGWGDSKLYDQLKSQELQRHQVYFLENASDQELQWCYEHCLAMTLASLHEGFGLPVLEANSYNKPALLSDISIFREIGKGNYFAPPTDRVAWSELLIEASRLASQGELKTPEFNTNYWSHKQRAHEILKAIERLLRPAKA